MKKEDVRLTENKPKNSMETKNVRNISCGSYSLEISTPCDILVQFLHLYITASKKYVKNGLIPDYFLEQVYYITVS